MGTKEKSNLFTSYIFLIKALFGIFLVMILIYWVIANVFLPSEREEISKECNTYEGKWEQVLENGERLPVEIPGNIEAEFGEVITLKTQLPDEIYNGENICFRPIWQDVEIYVDDELRLSYSTKDSRPFGINSAMRYLFLELSEEDAGKELTYKFSSKSKYAGNVREVLTGDRMSIWMHLLEVSGIRTIISVFLILLSLFCIIVCVVMKFVYKKTLPLAYLAWTIFLCAFWMLSESDFRQLLFRNISVLSNVTYWCLMLIPFTLTIYVNEVQDGYYKKVYIVPVAYCAVMLVTGTVLQVFDIVQFVQQLPFIHLGLIFSIIVLIVTITIDAFKKRISGYMFVGIGVYGMLLTAILEMGLYYMGAILSLGTVLGIGLLFLLIMAIIKTGQDLFSTEKKRQQAIMAKEAQAKFLANMSHEIRTPINAIIGMNEMILRENEDTAIEDYAYNIKSASNMLLGLINDVLDFSKIESGQLELVEDTYHLAEVIQDELLLVRTRAGGKPISTHIDIDSGLPSKLWGDELRIKQVLTNLLSNAVKYTKEGTVTLKAFSKKTDADTVELVFSVIDTGIGIRQEDLSKLFNSFKRLELNKNRNIQGTGLGLNIAKQLVELMQGSIVVESEYGKGSVFTVTIPQKVMDWQPIGSIEASLYESRKEKSTPESLFTAPDAAILIVDDNAMNLALMKGLLKRTKMKVDAATGGRECLELTRKKKYDIIFMDHMMPELDGIETLHILRAEQSNLNQNSVVIALTANAIAGSREMYLDYGFNDYFTKPIQAEKMDALIIQHLPEKLVHMENKHGASESSNEEEKGSQSEKEQSESEPDLLDIDRELGLSYCLNSEEFYNEVLSGLCRQIEVYLPQLDEHFKNQDWKQYSIIAHGLKGNTLNIGASNFSKLSLQHELAGKEENAEFIIKEYPDYIKTLKKLLEKIEQML